MREYSGRVWEILLMTDVEFQRVQWKGFALKAGVGDEASVGKIQAMCVGESLEDEGGPGEVLTSSWWPMRFVPMASW